MQSLQLKLVQELTALRKGEGVTPLKLRDAPALRALAARAVDIPVDSLTNNQVYNFLISELAKLPFDDATLAAKSALGVENRMSKRLSTRRSHLGKKLAKHPDTIERYENQGISNFAAHLVLRSALLASNVDLHPGTSLSTAVKAQAQAARSMTVTGLAAHLSLPSHSDELMRYLEVSGKPYMDTNVHISLLPSDRGPDWYRFRLSYTFQGGRETFRVAVVLNNMDGDQLVANGLVDDYHRLDNPTNARKDIKTIMANSKLIIRNTVANTQKLLRLRELNGEQAERILSSTNVPLRGTCRLLEINIPSQWQLEHCTCEYLSLINLPIANVAYWYSPTLMFLKKLTLDFSRFPDAHKREFFLLPFLGHAPGNILNEKYLYSLNLNSWIMPGHGVVLGWQDAPAAI
ncbi:MAG TPA: hypothetical protein VFZ48_03715 [Candidatus Saccharimonadales bacterium]